MVKTVNPVCITLESSLYQRTDLTVGVSRLLLLGTDAEVLMKKPSGKLVFPHEIEMPQERPNASVLPRSTLWKADYGDWHGDGYAAELCVSPFNCIDQGMSHIGRTMDWLRRRVKYTLEMPVIYSVPDDVVQSAPEQVRMLGCMPSFSVYNEEANPSALGETERTTGFHMHMSDPWLDSEKADRVIRWADIYCGALWTLVAPTDPKIEARRRQCYGRAGEHRKNIYPNGVFGFEYRVLPGTVLSHPIYISMMFNLFRHAFHAAFRGEAPEEMTKMARIAINEADRVVALELLKQLPVTEPSQHLLQGLVANTPTPLSTQDLINNLTACQGHRKFMTGQTSYTLIPR